MKKNRIKVVGIIFMAAIIGFTFVSRAAQSITTAIVETKKAVSGKISHEISSSGKIESASEYVIQVPEGLWVKELSVKEGDEVEQDTLLFVTSGNTNLMRVREDFLAWERKASMNLSGLADTYLQAYEDWQRYLVKTKNWYWKADDDLKEDELELTVREKEYEYFDCCKTYYINFATEEKIRLGLLTGNLENANKVTVNSQKDCQKLQKELNTAQDEYWKYKRSRERSYQFSRQEDEKKCREALEKAIPEYKEALGEYEGDLFTKVRAIEDAFNSYIDEEGNVFTTIPGIVQEINIKEGATTPASASIVIAMLTQKKQVQIQVSADMEEYLSIGDESILKKYGTSEEISGQRITNIEYNEKDNALLDITVETDDEFLGIGDMVAVEINKQSEQYSFVLPLDCIHIESGNTYILALKETEGILGSILKAEKLSVKILEKNSDYVAVTSDEIADREIIVRTDREVEAGSRIRKKVT